MMTWLMVVGFSVLAYIVVSALREEPDSRNDRWTGKKSKRVDLPEWLLDRWDRARKVQEAGEEAMNSEFPDWYFDDPTEAQRKRIDAMGMRLSGGVPTKGQASDLIGLSMPVDIEDAAEFAKVFELPKPKSQTHARAQRAQMLATRQGVEKWRSRLASTVAKERLRLVGVKPSQGLTAADAETLEAEAVSENEFLQAKLRFFEDWLDRMSDKDERESMGVARKPTASQIRRTIEALDLPVEPTRFISVDEDVFLAKLFEISPGLED